MGPISSVCLVMDGIDGQLLEEIAPAIGMSDLKDVDGADNFAMVNDIVGQCIVHANVSASLMDIVFTRNSSSGEKITMRTKIETEIQGPIISKFQEAQDQLNSKNMTLGNNSDMQNLRKLLRDNPVDSLIVPVDSLPENPDFEDLGQDTR